MVILLKKPSVAEGLKDMQIPWSHISRKQEQPRCVAASPTIPTDNDRFQQDWAAAEGVVPFSPQSTLALFKGQHDFMKRTALYSSGTVVYNRKAPNFTISNGQASCPANCKVSAAKSVCASLLLPLENYLGRNKTSCLALVVSLLRRTASCKNNN